MAMPRLYGECVCLATRSSLSFCLYCHRHVAGGAVERPDLVVGPGVVQHPVDDQRIGLEAAIRAARHVRPGRSELGHVAGVDRGERAVVPRLVGAVVRHPVVRLLVGVEEPVAVDVGCRRERPGQQERSKRKRWKVPPSSHRSSPWCCGALCGERTGRNHSSPARRAGFPGVASRSKHVFIDGSRPTFKSGSGLLLLRRAEAAYAAFIGAAPPRPGRRARRASPRRRGRARSPRPAARRAAHRPRSPGVDRRASRR